MLKMSHIQRKNRPDNPLFLEEG
jgi:hypothetical protein